MRKALKYWLLVFLVLGLFLPLGVSADNSTPKPAPDFKLMDLYQDTFTLSNYRDKQAVVLFFWASWCPFCQKELTVLNNMYPGIVKDGAEALSINVGELPDVVNNFVQSYHLAYRVLLDKDTSVSRAFQTEGVPTYILVDKRGGLFLKEIIFLKENTRI